MFGGFATFLFGSTAPTDHNERRSQINENQENGELEKTLLSAGGGDIDWKSLSDGETITEVTSLTPSVTGTIRKTKVLEATAGSASATGGAIKRNKPSKAQRASRHQLGDENAAADPRSTTHLSKSHYVDDDVDEDGWLIVRNDQEADKENHLYCGKGEKLGCLQPPADDATVIEVEPVTTGHKRYSSHIHMHSHPMYNERHSKKQRHLIQKTLDHNGNHSSLGNSRSASLSSYPSRGSSCSPTSSSLCSLVGNSDAASDITIVDDVMQCSDYILPAEFDAPRNGSTADNVSKTNARATNAQIDAQMEESWFITPPPCFTSIGPINMETSPFENLLIEHPSMSVYYSIRSAEQAMALYNQLETKKKKKKKSPKAKKAKSKAKNNTTKASPPNNATQMNKQLLLSNAGDGGNNAAQHRDQQTVTPLKEKQLAQNMQKNQNQMERQKICRGAIKRANKAYDIQSTKGRPQRRSDRQHCKVVSGANNNRKSC